MHLSGAEFVKLLTENYNQIYGYIIRLQPCYDVAEDLMQETTSSMWEQRRKFTPGTNFVAWGRTIAYYKIMDYRHQTKRDKKVIFNEELLKIIEQSMPSANQHSDTYLQTLRNCLTRLKSDDLQLLRLRYWKGITVNDISKRLKISLRNVYYQLARIQGLLLICVERNEK